MKIQDITSHTFDDLIGETLVSHFDLFHDLAIRVTKDFSLNPFQQSIWDTWEAAYTDFAEDDTAIQTILSIHQKRSGYQYKRLVDDPYNEISGTCKRAHWLTGKFTRIRNRITNSLFITQEELQIWKAFKHAAIPHSLNFKSYSEADWVIFFDLEPMIIAHIAETLDWDLMQKIHQQLYS